MCFILKIIDVYFGTQPKWNYANCNAKLGLSDNKKMRAAVVIKLRTERAG